jgi:hypothetical protein
LVLPDLITLRRELTVRNFGRMMLPRPSARIGGRWRGVCVFNGVKKKRGRFFSRFQRPASGTIPEGFAPITQVLAEDVVIVSYPRSGNTWFQNLVAGVVYGVDPRFGPSVLAHDLVPDPGFGTNYRRYATPMFFM